MAFVGPNNSGKSATLKSISHCIERGKDSRYALPVVSVSIATSGTSQDFKEMILSALTPVNRGYLAYKNDGTTNVDQLEYMWSSKQLKVLSDFLCRTIYTTDRLALLGDTKRIPITAKPYLPIHHMLTNRNFEQQINGIFREAFGKDLIVNHGSGENIELRVGLKPKSEYGHDRVSRDYVEQVEQCPNLTNEGDGIRSFAGVIVNLLAPAATITLLDEPETFLHPPQSRLLGRILAREHKADAQLFVATHSGDILRGLIDVDNPRLRIIRLQRNGDIASIRELNAQDTRKYWKDPLIRYSNILDGIFHEKVVLCEGDSDNRFYAAILDTIWSMKGKDLRRPDVMFAHCGGKSRLPMVVEALRQLGVPVAVIADFDILNNEYPLRDIAQHLGVAWADIEKHWRIIKDEIEKNKPPLDKNGLRDAINKIIDESTATTLTSKSRNLIENELKRSSLWSEAKRLGKRYIPSGDASSHANQLFDKLEVAGLHIVPVGEVEGWVKEVGNHGPQWVAKVLETIDLRGENLKDARSFVEKITGSQ
ncbi:atpase aaa : ATP-dependent endonuclease of the OLD family OS=Gloeobacter kilaueensis JS1 GN=GKIL_2201 PE=4 SV=1: AAA_21 [Gemmata massiliana]|uniref:Uncharacterized protein n=1 Tax=Gemmata massiliana TaxID=1210884 RepID=A0A6P2DLL1_9BACT|nr:atpase aaa : ATP-dependent endonuclease of the OLD family OS=Gloeobacter kilaueensis JS1 GN=GKIL_2201 PE=4 SV=1: AAA_21 [Gemmata massiliana]